MLPWLYAPSCLSLESPSVLEGARGASETGPFQDTSRDCSAGVIRAQRSETEAAPILPRFEGACKVSCPCLKKKKIQLSTFEDLTGFIPRLINWTAPSRQEGAPGSHAEWNVLQAAGWRGQASWKTDCFRKVTFPWGKLGYYPADDLTGAGQEIPNRLRSWEGLNLQLGEV